MYAVVSEHVNSYSVKTKKYSVEFRHLPKTGSVQLYVQLILFLDLT